MEFEVIPNSRMSAEHNFVRMSQNVREELGVLVGQFIQLRGEEELVLQILTADASWGAGAFIGPENFKKLNKESLEFQILEVTLGCDPEFFIKHKDRIISASTYLPFIGEIGSDGTLGELRPRYGRHERDVVQNLGRLIPQIPFKMRKNHRANGLPQDGGQCDFEAHSYHGRMSAGFHVHLGIPPEILNTRTDFNRLAMNHIVQCLDWYVSVPMLPLETNHQRRLGYTHYGRPGDYRPSNLTLEYRTPGAFYLRSPALTEGLLGLTLMVAENLVSKLKVVSGDFVNLNKLTKADLQEVMPIPDPKKIQATLLDRDIGKVSSVIDSIYNTVTGMVNYKKHQEGIERFFRIVESGQRPSANLLHNWGKEKS